MWAGDEDDDEDEEDGFVFERRRDSVSPNLRKTDAFSRSPVAQRRAFGRLHLPMDFQARIDEDLKSAMKARETERLGVLRMLKSALKLASIEQGGMDARLDDVAAMAIVRKELKKRQDSIEG